MDSDKIVGTCIVVFQNHLTSAILQMVLDAGRIVEFDTPRALLENEKSFLRALVEDSADKDTLYAMAKERSV